MKWTMLLGLKDMELPPEVDITEPITQQTFEDTMRQYDIGQSLIALLITR